MTWSREDIPNLRAVAARSLAFFTIIAVVVLGAIVYVVYVDFAAERSRARAAEEVRLSLASEVLGRNLGDVAANVRTLAHVGAVRDFVENPTAGNRTQVQDLFVTFARYQRTYDQIRVINAAGLETVRVNYNDGSPRPVPQNELQNKADRYYFRESIGLAKGSIYFSPLDLNIERGVVERPFKPMIRVATPLIDEQNQRRGVLVVNYLAQVTLKRFAQAMSDSWGSPMLLNGEGYWLYGTDKADEWGFMFDNGRTFGKRFSEAWDYMRGREQGVIETSAGYFLFRTVHPYRAMQLGRFTEAAGGDYTWIVVTRVPLQAVRFSPLAIFQTRVDAIALPLAASAVLAFVLAWLRTGNLQNAARLSQAAAVFDNTDQAIIITDAEDRIIAANKAFTGMSGYTTEEVLGTNPRLQHTGRETPDFYKKMQAALEASGRWEGEVLKRRKNGEVYQAWQNISVVKNARGAVANYVSISADISSLKQAEERMAYLAHHDALTGLPNRLLFGADLDLALERAKRRGLRVALMFLDLDRFKIINDTLGHARGDQLLQAVATRLRTSVRSEDVVARLGGDEFTVILSEIGHSEDAAMLADKIIRTISRPVQVDGHEVVSSASIGISVYPDDALQGDDLIKAADVAMYRAKERGRNTYQFYSSELAVKAFEYLSIEHGLRRALERGEFVLYYQPQVAMETGKIAGFEALIRWRDPQWGLVMPERFIPVAEESGLIEPMGDWVLRTACADIERWRAIGLPAIRVAVNLSARQIMREDFAEKVEAILAETPLKEGALVLELEITENLVQAAEHSIIALERLKSLGVSLAIDDFGTGYSSLSHLKLLPLDRLKIDRSFVRDIPFDANDEAIATAIIAMGHSLGLKIVGEGVENSEQLASLKAKGCDEVQGFFFSEAVSADAVVDLLAEE